MNDQHYTAIFAVDQTPERVFAAVTNPRGWWSEEIRRVDDEHERRLRQEVGK